jgi:hypothetical protein
MASIDIRPAPIACPAPETAFADAHDHVTQDESRTTDFELSAPEQGDIDYITLCPGLPIP